MQKRPFGLIVPKAKPVVRPSTLFDQEEEPSLPVPPVHRKAEKSKQEALIEDPAVFDYDSAFDEMKRIQQLRKEALRGGNSSQPKYVHQLMKAANLRKIEKERVDERKAQKEREREGDLYGDKETFVTAAFMERQAELKRLEEEEKKKEAMEESALKTGNMTGFYRNILNQNDRYELIQPILSSDIQIQETVETNDQFEKIEQLVKAGIVKVNDDNEVVDKRQLLVAGLNIPKKKQMAKQEEKRAKDEQEAKARELAKQQEMAKRKRVQEARKAQQYIEEQQKVKLEAERKRKEEALQELASKMAKKADEKTVSDAKARYLARKQQQKQESDSE